MIEANELRIGNWVKDRYNNMICVHSIVDDGINFYYDLRRPKYTQGRIYPIPLTEEILLKCGFDKAGIYYCMGGNKDIGIVLKLNDSMYCPIITSFGIPIKYLHQLQNLHFALVGKELEVKI